MPRGLRMFKRQSLTILCYHGVVRSALPIPDYCFLEASRFQTQMQWLARSHFRVAPLSEAISDLLMGRVTQPTVALTFDDGYRNNVDVALPILQRFNFPATIFLATGLIGSSKTIWPFRILQALQSTAADSVTWGGRSFPLATLAERTAANKSLQSRVKELAPGTPDNAAAEIERLLEVQENPDIDRNSPLAMMDADDVRLGVESGLLEFGAHSVTHPILSALDDDGLRREIDGSVQSIRQMVPKPSRCFAYPNGLPADFDARCITRLQDNGIAFAVSTVQAMNRPGADAYRLGRLCIGCDTTMLKFIAKTTGVSRLPGLGWAKRMIGR
ncbi:MAG: hypothetical protein C0524_04375 [Rhodobacter sp.]|nr:hypothetical protein [Rhodobacter sp.]